MGETVVNFERSRRSDWIATSQCDFAKRNDWLFSQCNSGGSGDGVGLDYGGIELIIAMNSDQFFGLTSICKFSLVLRN